MTDDVKALIAEARNRTTEHARQNPEGSVDLAFRLAAALEAATVAPAVDRQALARYFYMRNGGTEKNWDYLAERIRAGREPEHGRMICYQQADALLASGLLRDVRDVQAEALEQFAAEVRADVSRKSHALFPSDLDARAQAIREARNER